MKRVLRAIQRLIARIEARTNADKAFDDKVSELSPSAEVIPLSPKEPFALMPQQSGPHRLVKGQELQQILAQARADHSARGCTQEPSRLERLLQRRRDQQR